MSLRKFILIPQIWLVIPQLGLCLKLFPLPEVRVLPTMFFPSDPWDLSLSSQHIFLSAYFLFSQCSIRVYTLLVCVFSCVFCWTALCVMRKSCSLLFPLDYYVTGPQKLLKVYYKKGIISHIET